MNFFGAFGEKARLRQEKARLEAFLSAVPGEYCGWAQDGSVVYSQGFCDVLGLTHVEKISDIQNQISPEDSISLEGLFSRLMNDGTSFTINITNRSEDKTFKLSGTRGEDLSASDHFIVLWLEDITELKSTSDILIEEQAILQHDLDKLQEALDALPYPVWIRDNEHKIIWYCLVILPPVAFSVLQIYFEELLEA